MFELIEIHSDQKQNFHQFLNEWENKNDFIEIETSGSTGTPKKIKLLKRSMRVSATNTIEFFNLKEKDCLFLCLPLHTIAAKMMIVRAIVGKMRLIIHKPSKNPLKELNQDVKLISLTPMQMKYVIDESIHKTSMTQNILLGGAPVDYKLEQKLKEIDSCAVYHSYGMTETASHVAIRKIDKNQSDLFKAINGVTFTQTNDGCLIINYPTFQNEKIKTNDVVDLKTIDSFVWKGRKDFVINTGGVKVHAEELENKIASFFTKPFFISSIQDSYLGSKIIMIIESKIELDGKKILSQISTMVPPYSVPKEIYYLTTFERTKSGKLNRKKSLSNVSTK